MIVNVTGSLMLGLMSQVTPPTITVLGVGGLGAYTTFSSFARDAVGLAETNKVILAVVYVALSQPQLTTVPPPWVPPPWVSA